MKRGSKARLERGEQARSLAAATMPAGPNDPPHPLLLV